MKPEDFTDPFQRYVAEQFAAIASSQTTVITVLRDLTKRLDRIDERLNRIDAVLDKHTDLLLAIDRRLDEHETRIAA